MHKIHRRKNEDIDKDFPCSQNCGKAYGSFAAMYTHVRNKHPNAKPPEMKGGHVKTKQPMVRKVKLQPVRIPQIIQGVDYDCKTCKLKDCTCYEDIDEDEMDLSVALLSDQTFIKFINYVGKLELKDKFIWVRDLNEPYHYMNKQALREFARNFSVKFQKEEVELSGKWLDFLSLSSKYWDRRYIAQLYSAILAILSRQNSKQLHNFFTTYGHAGQQFQNVSKVMEGKSKEWNEFVELVRIL